MIPVASISALKKTNMARLVPNAISIHTAKEKKVRVGTVLGGSFTRGYLECPDPHGPWAMTEGAALAQIPFPLPGSSSSCRCASERPRTSS